MKVLKNWLEEFIKIDASDEKLADLLTFSGTLVEDVSRGLHDNIVVAQIKDIKPHPNADRLRIATVNDGKEDLQIVCGANNIEVGQIVPLAKIGAILVDMVIKEAEIRGVKSYGMMCSSRELGLGEDHDGIYLLPDDYVLGEPLHKYLGGDSIFDLEITPNRGDCLSHLGVAREISALTGEKLLFDENKFTQILPEDKSVDIEISNPDLCYRYSCAKIEGVKIAPSPKWLVDRLVSIGAKPINNVVDITNFIMYDLGQPLHAFDGSKISQEKIIVRLATPSEKITTIDGIQRSLDDQMLVISDDQKALAVAGVMGGQSSAINYESTTIILESAVFERKSIRRASKTLGLVTDASARFERGIDAQMSYVALAKAAKMICEIAGGSVVASRDDFPTDIKNDFIKVEHDQINELIGLTLDPDKIDEYLKNLGFILNDGMAQPPSWRHDCEIWQDLAEEVARCHGFENISPVPADLSESPRDADFYIKEMIKDILVGEGYCEVFSYPFLSVSDLPLTGVNQENLLEVVNPIQNENKYMRSSLTVGLLKSIAKNPTFDPIKIFEVGNVFSLTQEVVNLGIAVSGKGAGQEIEKIIQIISAQSGLDKSLLQATEFSKDDLARYKIRKANTFVIEIEIAKLVDSMRKSVKQVELSVSDQKISYREISKYPPVNRDLAFVVDTSVPAEDLKAEILNVSESVVLVEIFDEFTSDRLGENKKSIALHVWLQDLDKTLSDAQADEEIEKIISALQTKFEAKLRE